MNRPGDADDPVRRRRASAERLARVASRTGYLLIAAAVVIFFIALVTGFEQRRSGSQPYRGQL